MGRRPSRVRRFYYGKKPSVWQYMLDEEGGWHLAYSPDLKPIPEDHDWTPYMSPMPILDKWLEQGAIKEIVSGS